MTHIGPALTDAELFSDHPGRSAAPVPIVPNEGDVTKGLAVIRALLAAGLRAQFQFDVDDAKALWGARLAAYPLNVCMEAVRQWIAAPGTDFPSVGDVEKIAAGVSREWESEAAEEMARTGTRWCTECGGVRWIRVKDATPVGHHMRPCPSCPEMRTRSDLYDGDHFEAEHVERGGCMDCRDYQRPWHEVDRARRARR